MNEPDHTPAAEPTVEPARPAVWVASERLLDDTYVCVVHPTPDLSIPLSGQQATDYALEVFRVAGIAEYEAAIVAEITSLPGERDAVLAAAELVSAMRDRYDWPRRTRPTKATRPLEFTAIVAKSDHSPQVQAHLNGDALTQWTPAEARQHASHVLQVALGAALDGLYFATLIRTVGLDRDASRLAVHMLSEHRWPDGTETREPDKTEEDTGDDTVEQS